MMVADTFAEACVTAALIIVDEAAAMLATNSTEDWTMGPFDEEGKKFALCNRSPNFQNQSLMTLGTSGETSSASSSSSFILKMSLSSTLS